MRTGWRSLLLLGGLGLLLAAIRTGWRSLLLLGGLGLLLAAIASPSALAAVQTRGTFVASNCAPVASSSDGTMVWYSRDAEGLWNAYIGNEDCEGAPLLPAYTGNRGPADISANGRYVLLTTAVGLDKNLPDSSPGEGSGNAIELYDRQTRRLSTLLAGATASQRGVIWPTFNSNDTKIVWSQMTKTAAEDPPDGEWALHVADVNLEAGTLSDNVEWQDPDGDPAFYEAYGWIPNTGLLVFMSNTRATSTGFRNSQLFTLPEELNPSTPPTRISPPFAPTFPWQIAENVFHEFAHFAPGAPSTLYTSIAANTDGGDDLYAYDMKTQEADGLLGQPTRISYFGGNMDEDMATDAVPGWPTPTYTVVTTMAWENGAWVASTCPDMLCSEVNAWRIEGLPTEASGAPGAEATAAPSAEGSAASHASSAATKLSSDPGSSGSAPPGSAEVSSPRAKKSALVGRADGVALVARKLEVSGAHATVELRCRGGDSCRGRLTVSARRRVSGDTAATQDETLVEGAFAIAARSRASVRLRIDGAGRAMLAAAHGALKATLTIVSRPSASGQAAAASAPVLRSTARLVRREPDRG